MINKSDLSQTPNYKGVNIEETYHTMLSRLAEKERRSMSDQAEVIIEAAYNAMLKAEHASQVMAAGIGRIPDLHAVGQ